MKFDGVWPADEAQSTYILNNKLWYRNIQYCFVLLSFIGW